jgi:SAM-dependent methyltransferase
MMNGMEVPVSLQQYVVVTVGLIYVNPRPDPDHIGHYYPTNYTPYFIAIADEPSWWQRFNRRLAMRKRANLIQRQLPRPGHVLDVGCATGSFLVALRDVGWQVQGVEFNPQAADICPPASWLDVVTGTLADGRFPDKQFDLVIFWDVLEHVHHPLPEHYKKQPALPNRVAHYCSYYPIPIA